MLTTAPIVTGTCEHTLANINFIAPINSLGYGVVGANLALAFKALGHRLALWPLGNVEAEGRYAPAIQEMVGNQRDYDAEAPSIRLWRQCEMAEHVGRGLHCGYPIFELDTFDAQERHHLSQLDRIIVASRWAQRVVVEQVGCPIERTIVAPFGVDRSIFHEPVGLSDPEWTTFLNIGKWELRKGHDALLTAFNRAFDLRDRVRLVMLSYNPFLSPEQNAHWERSYKGSKLGDNIVILPRKTSHAEVAAIMATADCGVFPSRAEGWNLELLEMMSMGKSVIATNYSGHTEYCSTENSLLVDVDSLETANDGIWFYGQGRWAALKDKQVEQLAARMREIHEQKRTGLPVNRAGVATAKRHSGRTPPTRFSLG